MTRINGTPVYSNCRIITAKRNKDYERNERSLLYTQDQAEIDKCLNCPKPICTNCLGHYHGQKH